MRLALLAVALVGAAMPALACRAPVERHSAAGWVKRAQQAVVAADLIVDGRVVAPMNLPRGKGTALVQVTRVLKGNVSGTTLTVRARTTCDHALERQGEPVRLLLTATSPPTAPRHLNAIFASPSDLRRFAAEIDRALGVPRPAGASVWPGVPMAMLD